MLFSEPAGGPDQTRRPGWPSRRDRRPSGRLVLRPDQPSLHGRPACGGLEDTDSAFKMLNPPFRFRDMRREAPAFVARLGEHTDSVLADLKEPS